MVLNNSLEELRDKVGITNDDIKGFVKLALDEYKNLSDYSKDMLRKEKSHLDELLEKLIEK